MSQLAESPNSPDTVLNQLTGEFQNIPVRIVIDIFCSYLKRLHEAPLAAEATRRRILDACLAA